MVFSEALSRIDRALEFIGEWEQNAAGTEFGARHHAPSAPGHTEESLQETIPDVDDAGSSMADPFSTLGDELDFGGAVLHALQAFELARKKVGETGCTDLRPREA